MCSHASYRILQTIFREFSLGNQLTEFRWKTKAIGNHFVHFCRSAQYLNRSNRALMRRQCNRNCPQRKRAILLIVTTNPSSWMNPNALQSNAAESNESGTAFHGSRFENSTRSLPLAFSVYTLELCVLLSSTIADPPQGSDWETDRNDRIFKLWPSLPLL